MNEETRRRISDTWFHPESRFYAAWWPLQHGVCHRATTPRTRLRSQVGHCWHRLRLDALRPGTGPFRIGCVHFCALHVQAPATAALVRVGNSLRALRVRAAHCQPLPLRWPWTCALVVRRHRHAPSRLLSLHLDPEIRAARLPRRHARPADAG